MNAYLRFFLSTLIVLLIPCSISWAHPAKDIVHPQSGSVFDKHHRYPVALLELALAKSGKDYRLLPSEQFMTQGRAVKQLRKNQDIDVMWTMTSKEREDMLSPVRIPIYRGLIGWRVLVTRTNNTNVFANPPSNEMLQSFTFVQGHDWPDTRILRSHGFIVESAPDFDSLFKLVIAERADFFPRSIIEVWDELETWKDQGLALEENLLIRYPTASYFFTSKENNELNHAIQRGLELAISDGSFDQLFTKHFGQFIAKARLDKRKHHRFGNPLLSPETPLQDARLWFEP